MPVKKETTLEPKGTNKNKKLKKNYNYNAKLPTQTPPSHLSRNKKAQELDFLGTTSNLVIIINADEDEEGSADQEEHGTCGYPATLNQGDSGNCRRRKETRQRLVMQNQKETNSTTLFSAAL